MEIYRGNCIGGVKFFLELKCVVNRAGFNRFSHMYAEIWKGIQELNASISMCNIMLLSGSCCDKRRASCLRTDD